MKWPLNHLVPWWKYYFKLFFIGNVGNSYWHYTALEEKDMLSFIYNISILVAVDAVSLIFSLVVLKITSNISMVQVTRPHSPILKTGRRIAIWVGSNQGWIFFFKSEHLVMLGEKDFFKKTLCTLIYLITHPCIKNWESLEFDTLVLLKIATRKTTNTLFW